MTSGGTSSLAYYRNLSPSTGASWSRYNIEPIPPGTDLALFDLDLGDGNKSQYLGR